MELKLPKDYVAIKEVSNPFKKTKAASGILLIGADVAMSDETGQMEKLEQIVKFGIVTIVGPEAKTLKVGDGVYYDQRTLRPIPFYEPVFMFNEGNIIGYVQDENGSIQKAVDDFDAEQMAEARKTNLALNGKADFEGLVRVK